jgi:hypothetical protein
MAESPAQGAKKVTKLDAVEQAMKALGKDATREQLRGYVKDTFGYDMTPDHISNCKGDLAKRAKKAKAKVAAKKAAAPKPAPQPAVPAQVKAKAAANSNGKADAIALQDVLALKALVDRVGADGLRTLIAAFER